MRPLLFPVALMVLLGAREPAPGRQAPSPVQLRFDTTEAALVLGILEARTEGRAVEEQAWPRLFATAGYRRLHEREAAMGRPFTDSQFVAFVGSDSLARRAGKLRRALTEWARVDVSEAGAKALAYLPRGARIRATVYVMIKPVGNSFVWDLRRDPAIFLYLDPTVSAPKLANTIAHELHHVGYAGLGSGLDSLLATLADSVRAVADLITTFGEGFAMLAAAGGPDVHPHAVSPPAERARWDRDQARLDRDVASLDRFFRDVLSRRLTAPDSIGAVAATFFGIQGPWYTVGWAMAAAIERRFGRAELIRAMQDPIRLMRRYDEAAARAQNRALPRFSAELLRGLGADRAPPPGAEPPSR